MELSTMKIKIISLLICTLFLTSIFPGLTTAKNLVSIDTGVADFNFDLRRDLIKISDIYSICDLDNDFVVYTYGANAIYDHLFIYNIKTGETDDLFLGGDMVYPKIYEHRVVFCDFVYGGFKMYDIDTSETTDLIVTNWPGGESDAFQFLGDYIVYENTNSGLEDTEIFLYDIATNENIQLTDSPDEGYSEKPCIYGNIVAWQLTESMNKDIVMYTIDSGEYTRVTNTSNHVEEETFPSIYEDTIVYNYYFYDKANGTELSGLKMYTISTGEETTLFIGEESTGRTPEIVGDIIAYGKSEAEPEEASLCLYDLKTNSNTSIYQGYMLAYPWNLNGNYIVFTVVLDGVYLYKYNNPPDSPEINGPASGKTGITYDYTFNAVDPNGDQVKYIIYWGDGKIDTTALNPSGVDVIVSHTWSKKGVYTIKAHAQDEYGSDGPESSKSVTIPRNKAVTLYSLITKVLERFPLLERILNFQ
jgi:hypothetical protein